MHKPITKQINLKNNILKNKILYFVYQYNLMSEEINNQDKAVEKIHREENLDDNDSYYNMDETLSDNDLPENEAENQTESA
jgi:hypothetical protein